MSSTPSSSWSNTQLIEECLSGNEQAWYVLVDRYKDLIYSIPLRFGAPPQDAADIFQAVCLDLFNELPKLRDAEAIHGWLVRVTANKCYHWRRRLSQERDVDADTLDLPGLDSLPSELLAQIERERLLREAIDQLAPRCREMITLLFFEQPPIPYLEVARRLRLAIGSIGFIRGRCLKRLKLILEQRGF